MFLTNNTKATILPNFILFHLVFKVSMKHSANVKRNKNKLSEKRATNVNHFCSRKVNGKKLYKEN